RVPLFGSHLAAIGPQPGDVALGVAVHRALRRGAGIDAAVLEEFAAVKVGVLATQLYQFTRALEQRFGVVIELPVDPTDLVVLGVGVVVAGLRAADLVAAANHGNA